MTTATNTTRWTTIATVGYAGGVSSKNQNPAAAGGVCHLEARRTRDGKILGRRVNTNGRAREEGESFQLDADTLEQWESIERCSR